MKQALAQNPVVGPKPGPPRPSPPVVPSPPREPALVGNHKPNKVDQEDSKQGEIAAPKPAPSIQANIPAKPEDKADAKAKTKKSQDSDSDAEDPVPASEPKPKQVQKGKARTAEETCLAKAKFDQVQTISDLTEIPEAEVRERLFT